MERNKKPFKINQKQIIMTLIDTIGLATITFLVGAFMGAVIQKIFN